jgi:hypothetical protein
MSKQTKKVKIWRILRDGDGYWTDNPEWIWEFKEMNHGEEFTIKCEELTSREFDKLERNSREFDGW